MDNNEIHNVDNMEELEELLKKEEKESVKTLQERNAEDLKLYFETKDEDLRNEIVTNNLRLVYKIADEFSKKYHVSIDDLIQEGSFGLMNAVENYDPKFETQLSTFAFPYITNKMNIYVNKCLNPISIPANVQMKLNKMKDAIKKLTIKLQRDPTNEEIANEMNESVDQIQEWKMYSNYKVFSDSKSNDDEESTSIQDYYPDPTQNPSELAKSNELYEKLMFEINALPEKKREIYKRKNGIGVEKDSLKNIAKDNDISLQRVAQICDEIDKQLKKKLKDFLE